MLLCELKQCIHTKVVNNKNCHLSHLVTGKDKAGKVVGENKT